MIYATQIFTAFIGSLGFSMLYNIRGSKLWYAALGGLLSWSTYLLLGLWLNNAVAQYFISAMIVTIYAEILARIIRTPTTIFLSAAIIPLVPGSALYYTMSYAISGMLEEFINTGLHTIALSVSLAAGIMVASSLYKISMVVWQHLNPKLAREKTIHT